MEKKIKAPINNPKKPNVLHLLKDSLPTLKGHTIRSHFILVNQKKFANPYGLTNPYYERKTKFDIIDNVVYFRYPFNPYIYFFHDSKISELYKIQGLFDFIYYSQLKRPLNFIKRIVKKYEINIIHGHTPEKFAKFGEIIAHRNGIPFVYEVRGFWEDTKVALGIISQKSKKYQNDRRKETLLIRKADAIVTLSNTMKKELIYRNIIKDKIFVIPNGVDIDFFKPRNPDIKLIRKFNLNNIPIIGYIGSIRKLEGIEILIKAMKIVIKEFENVKLLLIGECDGIYKTELTNLIKKLGLQKFIRFIGSVPLNQVINFYSIIDLIILPRLDTRVNRLVTPLKPLEAMAMKKVVIASDLPALRELIKPGISGDLFQPENYEVLAKKIKYYLSDNKKREDLANSARKFVENNYDWNLIILKYKSLYSKLLN